MPSAGACALRGSAQELLEKRHVVAAWIAVPGGTFLPDAREGGVNTKRLRAGKRLRILLAHDSTMRSVRVGCNDEKPNWTANTIQGIHPFMHIEPSHPMG